MQNYLKNAGPEADAVDASTTGQVQTQAAEKPQEFDPKAAKKVRQFIKALGGADNIKSLEECAHTRLRVVLKSNDQLNKTLLEKSAISGIVHLEDALHLIVGNHAQQYADEMRSLVTS